MGIEVYRLQQVKYSQASQQLRCALALGILLHWDLVTLVFCVGSVPSPSPVTGQGAPLPHAIHAHPRILKKTFVY